MMLRAACESETASSGDMTQAASALPEPGRALAGTMEAKMRQEHTRWQYADRKSQRSRCIWSFGETVDDLMYDAVAGHGRHCVVAIDVEVATDLTGVADVRRICARSSDRDVGQKIGVSRTDKVDEAAGCFEDGLQGGFPELSRFAGAADGIDEELDALVRSYAFISEAHEL